MDEAAYVEACLARRRELLALADGHVLARCEAAAVEMARDHGQRLLTDALVRRVAHAEQKKLDRPGSAGAGARHACGPDERVVLSAFGPITLTRWYFRCPQCRKAGCTGEPLLGLGGYLSPRALRLACRLAADRSFEVAADRLRECCGVVVSGETLRRHCTVADWMRTAPEAAGPFRRAAGAVEVQVDAGKVNTTGWRDLKVLGFAKRPRSPVATPEQWDTREPPAADGAGAGGHRGDRHVPPGLARVGGPVGYRERVVGERAG